MCHPLAKAAVIVTLVASRSSYVPFWGGRFCTNCVMDAANRPLSLGALRCGGHASHVYIGLAAQAQMLNAVRPTVVDIRVILSGRTRPGSGWFLVLPTGNVSRALTDLSRFYVIGEEQCFWRDGYSLSAYPLSMRSVP